jgi:hypothetical protein
MNLHHRSAITVESSRKRNASETRLQGAWLVLARVTWVVIAGLSIGMFVVALPSYFAYLHVINTTSPYGPQLPLSDVRELYRLGLSLDFYAWLDISGIVLNLLVYVLVGIVIFWRKSDDRVALLASLTLVLFPIGFNNVVAATLPPAWALLAECVGFAGAVCLGLFFYLFPSGQFVPRWAVFLMIVWIAEWANSDFFPNTPFNNSILSYVLFLVVVASPIILQIYRYRRVSTPVQRQQTKWVVFGIVLGFGSFLIGGFVLSLFFSTSPLVFTLEQIPLNLLVLVFPLSIGFAILRARLWEIDRLISRTLVYGTLTVALALVYAGLIIGLQALLGTIIKQNNDVAIVISTLAIAALFQPLRHHIQRIIDRRFYRRKYDAAGMLADFSATLRNEVDLSQLREQLVAVVQETMQPAHISLWLRPTAPTRKEQATWSSPPPTP